jgi:transcriptional regulator with PAS, ATPase and Fis domain
MCDRKGFAYERCAALLALSECLVEAGDLARAEECARTCQEAAIRLGDPIHQGEAAYILSKIAYASGELIEAVRIVSKAKRSLSAIGASGLLMRLEAWLSRITEPSAFDPSLAPAQKPQESVKERMPPAAIKGFITENSVVRQSLAMAVKLAPRSLSILVLGESGTGKEVVAEGIHAASNRKGPFVPVNCGALPGELLEAELFGHAKGAYTGADRERGGLIEHSHRGTLFLDEIGDMPLKAQARLLRALERGEIRRLGEVTPRLVDLRIIAATHRNLLEMVSAGDFRLDLYHRLTGFVLKLPPLRERAADVLLLIDHYVKLFTVEQDKDVRLSPDVRQELAHHAWPGNVRQLRNVLHRLVSLAEPGQTIARLPFELEGEAHPRSFSEVLDAEEKRRILDALQSHNWNKAKAALALGSSRTTLIGKMKRLGIDLESPGARVR